MNFGYHRLYIAGLCWFAALGVYGQGSALLGEIGPVIGWPMSYWDMLIMFKR